jgi:hypothetical protein
MLIEDGQGSGRTAGVNAKNRLKTVDISSSVEHNVNHEEGRSYNMIFQVNPTSSNPSLETEETCFAYIKNNSDIDLCFEGIDLRLAGTGEAEIIKIKGGDSGTPIGGTEVTPVNLNLGSGKQANGTFLKGSNITGLSGGTTLRRIYIGSSNTSETFNFEQDIIVPKNNVLTIYAVNGGAEVATILMFNFHDAKDAG